MPAIRVAVAFGPSGGCALQGGRVIVKRRKLLSHHTGRFPSRPRDPLTPPTPQGSSLDLGGCTSGQEQTCPLSREGLNPLGGFAAFPQPRAGGSGSRGPAPGARGPEPGGQAHLGEALGQPLRFPTSVSSPVRAAGAGGLGAGLCRLAWGRARGRTGPRVPALPP